MKILYLTRHAKSSWDEALLSDHVRPLNARGLRDAPLMARKFAERGEPLDILISSTATRAWATASFFAQALAVPLDTVRTEPLAYLAHAATLLGLVNNFPDTADRVMLFGHNPGLSTFCADLCEHAPGELITCHTVRIDLFVDQWAHVSMGSGIVRWHDDPKRHPSA